MRLLSTTSFKVVDFPEGRPPPYAILSHTWGEEEVTFQDIQHLHPGRDWASANAVAVRKKRGFSKVRDATAFAQAEFHEYIWIDTCCIDKSSSAELSEAINSMFKWYSEAAVCYAFLSDVPPAAEQDPTWEGSSFRQSRWFTRGWTLQELIAPREVHFKAEDWTHLGSKTDRSSRFQEVLSAITGISLPVLCGRLKPYSLSVASRMRWAAHRQTTRVEDIAYCLLGIFDVNMSLLYGEGKKAFLRLQEQILMTTADQSVFAWNSYDEGEPDPDAVCGLFAESPHQFKDADNIQVVPPPASIPTVPFALTSHGLSIQLYLRLNWEEFQRTGDEDYFAILDCSVRIGTESLRPTLLLRRLSYDQYGRLRPGHKLLLPPVDYNYPTSVEGYAPIYVRQVPVYYSLPSFFIPPPGSRPDTAGFDLESPTYTLEEVFPDSRWNPDTATLEPVFARDNGLVGVLRYRKSTDPSPFVDIAIGLTKTAPLKWDGWCFQRQATGKPLPAVFADLSGEIQRRTTPNTASPHWFGLQGELGDDMKLASEARVRPFYLHGRTYVALYVLEKVEICTSRELTSVPPTFLDLQTATEDKELIWLTTRLTVADPLVTDKPPMRKEILGVRTKLDDSSMEVWLTAIIYQASEGHTLDVHQSLVTGKQPQGPGRLSSLASKAKSKLTNSRSSILGSWNKNKDGGFSEGLRIMGLTESSLMEHSEFLGAEPVSDRLLAEMNTAALHGDTGKLGQLFDDNDISGLWMHPLITPMHIAAVVGNPKTVRFILNHRKSRSVLGYIINARTRGLLETPLHLLAAYAPKPRQVQCFKAIASAIPEEDLVTAVTARNSLDETTIHRAVVSDNVELIDCLIEIIEKRNQKHNRSEQFHSLIETYQSDFVLNLNYKDIHGRTPVWHAAAIGSCSSIECLSRYGASLDIVDDVGLRPLHAACREGRAAAVQLLISLGANPYVDTPYLDLTPLHMAVAFRHIDCVQSLVATNLDVNFGRETSMRPIHIAAASGSFECVEALITAGASCSLPCMEIIVADETGFTAKIEPGGQNALEIARRRLVPKIASLLESAQQREATQSQVQQQQQQLNALQNVNLPGDAGHVSAGPSGAHVGADGYTEAGYPLQFVSSTFGQQWGSHQYGRAAAHWPVAEGQGSSAYYQPSSPVQELG